jgi:hypothetical protein
MQAERSARSPQPGECLNVCAACGGHVIVVPAAGIPPVVNHKPECPREGWPVQDAIAYDDELKATRDNWPNGDGGKYVREQEAKGTEPSGRTCPDCGTELRLDWSCPGCGEGWDELSEDEENADDEGDES